MTSIIAKINNKPIFFRSLLFSTSAFALAWLLTFFSIRLIWGRLLNPLNPLILIADFLLPLGVIIVFTTFVGSKEKRFKILAVLFLLLFAFALVNIFVLDSRIMNYGDRGTLGAILGSKMIFPRWMIGSGLLEYFLTLVVFPLFRNVPELLYVKIMSAVVMCVCSIVLILRCSPRLSVLLALTTPIWLLFTTGYDEYYPFIVALFILFLLLLTEKRMQTINPLTIGILVAVIGLFYAGFVPLSLFLLGAYTLQRGFKKGALALLFTLIAAVLLVLLFYRSNFLSFPGEYLSTLNLEGAEEVKGIYIEKTPFYTPAYAFSGENLKRVFTQLFWTGSLPYLFLIIGGLSLFFKRILRQAGKLPLLLMGLFLLFQIVYLFFMIPYLGVVTDIDLFFTVYLTLAFTAGWLVDAVTADLENGKKMLVKTACFSFCAGSSVVVLIYFMFLGLYAIV